MMRSLLRRFTGLACELLCGVLIVPLALLVPKRMDWVAVIGRQNGKFLDNAKHFFVQASAARPDLRVVFIAADQPTAALIKAAGREAVRCSSLSATWFLVRCGCVVVDSMDWGQGMRRHWLVRTGKIQLWHGIPLKLIELDRWRSEAGIGGWYGARIGFWVRCFVYRVSGRLVTYDLLVAPSKAILDASLRSAIPSRKSVIAGYPRNSFGAEDGADVALVWSNVDAQIVSRLRIWKEEGRRIVIVMPTFRDSGDAPFSLGDDEINAIDAFCEANACEFVFKLHPADRSMEGVSGRHVHWFDPDADIYPLLPYSAALITDYSSIYFDYLLVDRPIIFYRSDDYSKTGRGIYKGMSGMAPGPCVDSWSGLLEVLRRELGHDGFRERRSQMQRLCFDGLDQSLSARTILAAALPVAP